MVEAKLTVDISTGTAVRDQVLQSVGFDLGVNDTFVGVRFKDTTKRKLEAVIEKKSWSGTREIDGRPDGLNSGPKYVAIQSWIPYYSAVVRVHAFRPPESYSSAVEPVPAAPQA
jgi:hypothetical protein